MAQKSDSNYGEWIRLLKETRREYMNQNKEFVRILEYYATTKQGALARAALDAWFQRISESSELERHYYEKREMRKEKAEKIATNVRQEAEIKR